MDATNTREITSIRLAQHLPLEPRVIVDDGGPGACVAQRPSCPHRAVVWHRHVAIDQECQSAEHALLGDAPLR